MKALLRNTLLSTLFISTLFTGEAMAGDYRQNPFTLTYDGAISRNRQGKANIQTVHYQADGYAFANGYDSTAFKTSV